MDAITQVTRKSPQTLFAVPVSPNNAGQISALFGSLLNYGYTTINQTGTDFPGGWRLIIKYTAGAADQVIYSGDLILVSDATYSNGAWTVSAATRVSCYGVSTELAGTVADFDNTFTAVGGS